MYTPIVRFPRPARGPAPAAAAAAAAGGTYELFFRARERPCAQTPPLPRARRRLLLTALVAAPSLIPHTPLTPKVRWPLTRSTRLPPPPLPVARRHRRVACSHMILDERGDLAALATAVGNPAAHPGTTGGGNGGETLAL